ncbi:MAG: phosphoribosylanthranilate isomerase [Gemmatimonadaceae bacterium]
MTEIKFCGLTRSVDVAAAVAAGARYVGFILTAGRRMITDERAIALARHAAGARTVGVFGDDAPDVIAARAVALGLDVAQLHADPSPSTIAALRRVFPGEIWATVRVGVDDPPAILKDLLLTADAVVLDTLTHRLGGTGVSFDWNRAAPFVDRARAGGGRLVLAGGLTPENVAGAISALRPDVVDVASGVERSAGIKDHSRLRAFADAVGATVLRSCP